MKNYIRILVFWLCLIGWIGATSAEEVISKSDTIKTILEKYTGQVVILRLDNGNDIEGKLTSVSDFLVYISKLSDRSFYDAYVQLESINAVIVKTRTK
ncbi:MAG: hypothetical protein HQK77_04740 [Desulfobacterales bacterium]|nr:hypothetical protein [Desulfobacterales bacterium]